MTGHPQSSLAGRFVAGAVARTTTTATNLRGSGGRAAGRRSHHGQVTYDDGRIAFDDRGLIIRRYYLWGSAKRIPYSAIRSVNQVPLTALSGRWRIWGSADFRHWWNLDRSRLRKHTGFVLDVGGRVRPSISPDDPDAVARIFAQRTAG